MPAGKVYYVSLYSANEYKKSFIKAIEDINTTIFSEDAGGRPEAEKTVLLLLTQGKHDGNHSITTAAAQLHEDPKYVYSHPSWSTTLF